MIDLEYKKSFSVGAVILILVLSVYVAIKAVSEFNSENLAGSKMESTIVLSGHGEVNAVPDIASVSFTIHKEAKTVKEAQEQVALVEKKALDFLKANNVADKDIKTENVSFYPKYEYQYETKSVPCNEYGCPPRPGKNVLTGYEASESITVKIRNTVEAGKIIEGLGGTGVENLNGPNFEIDDEDALKAEARKKAIDDAKAKAQVLAKDLGVRLGKVVNFNESGSYYPTPMMYAKDAMGSARAESAPAELPKGENTISSDVTITYEIK